MFKFLKDKLKKSVEKLSKRAEEEIEEQIEEQIEEKIYETPREPEPREPEIKYEAKPEAKHDIKPEIKHEPKPRTKEEARTEVHVPKPSIIKKEPTPQPKLGLIEKITTKVFSESDIDDFFSGIEGDFLQANVALEVIDFLREQMKSRLVNQAIRRGEAKDAISEAFEESLFATVNQGEVDLEKMIKHKKPVTCVFLGFNGSGKTTTIAKIAAYMKDRGYRPVLAAGDTFRAASIEQLEHHGEKLGVKVIRQQYGSDSAAVIFDARKFAESKAYDIVLADTAGRVHTDKNLMDEIEKVCRVNKPDLKVLIVDSLTGNDAVEQAKKFNEKVGVDAVVMTKTDVNEKGGSILSVCYAIRKPILFLGMGQGYRDIKKFDPKAFVEELMS